MAIWAIGDVHGCWRTLERLLRRIPEDDRLWLVGDLVNRGTGSLAVLRWAAAAGDRVTAVLGNHDLHLLARAEGVAEARPTDTLDELLRAPDRERLLEWLARRPLLVREEGWVLVHAGLWPTWSVGRAGCLARDAEAGIRGLARRDVLAQLASDGDPVWRDDLPVIECEARAAAVLSGLRMVARDEPERSRLHGPPQEAARGCRPWYDLRPPEERERFLFGHWAALGLHLGERAIGLDSGCAHGGALTAIRLADRQLLQEPCDPADRRSA